MKHTILFFVFAAAVYSGWYTLSAATRQEVHRFLKTHGLRAVFIVVVVLSALALVYQDIIPPVQLLK